MEKDIAIRLNHVSKVYRIYEKPQDRLKEALSLTHKRYSRDFYALNDVSLEIYRGDTVGFIGRNGAGKSTLLKLITGVATPTSGTIEHHGRIASLLELGAGFNPDMTGIENIFMNGTIMGFTPEQMEERLDDIVAFADIGDFIHQPVKTYSSGMFARVAFAVNAYVEPDILIVDEALSVGDAFFQTKCINRMKRMIDNGVTVLFVSHDISAVKNLCQRGVLMEKGQVQLDASAGDAVEKYIAIQLEARRRDLAELTPDLADGLPKGVLLSAQKMKKSRQDDSIWFKDNSAFLHNADYDRFQNGKAEFVNIVLLNKQGQPIQDAEYGDVVTLRMAVEAKADLPVIGAGFHLRNKDGVDLAYTDGQLEESAAFNVKKGDRYIMDWTFHLELREGDYNIACVLSIPINLNARQADTCDFVPCAVQFSIMKNKMELGGYMHVPAEAEIRKL